MKKSGIMAFSMMALLLAACNQRYQKDAALETEEETGEAARFTEERDSLARQIRSKVEVMDRRIDELQADSKAKLGTMNENARVSFNQTLDELKDQQSSLKSKLNELDTARAETWSRTKKEVNDLNDKVDQTYNRAVSFLRNTPEGGGMGTQAPSGSGTGTGSGSGTIQPGQQTQPQRQPQSGETGQPLQEGQGQPQSQGNTEYNINVPSVPQSPEMPQSIPGTGGQPGQTQPQTNP